MRKWNIHQMAAQCTFLAYQPDALPLAQTRKPMRKPSLLRSVYAPVPLRTYAKGLFLLEPLRRELQRMAIFCHCPNNLFVSSVRNECIDLDSYFYVGADDAGKV